MRTFTFRQQSDIEATRAKIEHWIERRPLPSFQKMVAQKILDYAYDPLGFFIDYLHTLHSDEIILVAGFDCPYEVDELYHKYENEIVQLAKNGEDRLGHPVPFVEDSNDDEEIRNLTFWFSLHQVVFELSNCGLFSDYLGPSIDEYLS